MPPTFSHQTSHPNLLHLHHALCLHLSLPNASLPISPLSPPLSICSCCSVSPFFFFSFSVPWLVPLPSCQLFLSATFATSVRSSAALGHQPRAYIPTSAFFSVPQMMSVLQQCWLQPCLEGFLFYLPLYKPWQLG